MNKTALQWFIYKITANHDKHFKDFYKAEIEEALQMEREQIIDSFSEGTKMIDVNDELSARFNACVYYVETYGGEK